MSEYRFFLYHKDVGSYTLIKDPIGWDTLGKKIKRFGLDSGGTGMRWHGVFFEFNVKLGFIKDGKAFIQNFYEKYGVEQEILLRIEKREGSHKFIVDYEGRLNLVSYEIDAIKVECTIENTGFLQKLKNRADVKVDTGSLISLGGVAINPLGGGESQNITLHSRTLRSLYTKKSDADVSNIEPATGKPMVPGKNYLLFSLNDFVVDEIDAREDHGCQISSIDPTTVSKYQFKVKYKGSYTFNIRPIYYLNTSGAINWTVKWFLTTGKPGAFTTTQIGSTDSATGTSEITGAPELINHIVHLLPDDEIYVYGECTVSSGGANFNYLPYNFTYPIHPQQVTFSIVADTKFVSSAVPTPTTKTVMIHEFWTRLIQSITDRKDADVFYSEYYGRTDLGYAVDGPGSMKAITNGFQLRGIDKPIYGTLKGQIDNCLALDGIGLGIERVNGRERVRVEPLAYWYQGKRMMRLNHILGIKKSVGGDLMYNTIEGGIDKWKNVKSSDLDEFNAKREWLTPITQVKKTLSLRSPYITSGSSIEYARRIDDKKQDSDVDNDNFVIAVHRDGGNFVPDTNEAFASASGIVDPETAYNLKLSPARCLRRNGSLIRSFLERYKDQKISFTFGEANSALFTRLTTESIGFFENDPIAIDTLEPPRFLAEIYSLRAKLTTDQMKALNNVNVADQENVWGFIEFSETDRDHKRGYLLSAQLDSESNEVRMELLKAVI